MSTATGERTWTRFATLGTEAFLSVRDPVNLPVAEEVAREVLDLVDATCSRFREDSDLAEVNRAAGSWVPVDAALVAAVTVARDAAEHTDGLVNPLLGRALVTLGYDRDLAVLRELPEPLEPAAALPAPTPGAWRQIGIDPAGAVRIPAGTALDLGATCKAWAADVIAEAWASELGAAGLISLGGDLRIAAPDGAPWAVALAERPTDTPTAVLTIDAGGLATSSTQQRRWTRAGARHHHLLDPRTGAPAREVWRTVTATGPTCAAANTATTAAIVLGEAAPAWLAERAVDARLVAADGSVMTVGAWPTDQHPDEESAR